MAVATLPLTLRTYRPGPAAMLLGGLVLAVLLAVLGQRLIAQVEGDRGIIPVATSSDIQVDGIEVESTGPNANEARLAGWKQAQKLAWAKAGGAPMADGVIESMVAAVVIEREQIGPRRYIARLGVVFDRERAGRYLGGGGTQAHSAPLLTIPVLYSGGTAQVYEVKGAWQKAWAEYHASGSAIDYVRPAGAGGESLLITAGQPGRRSRAWWRNVLDQFGASDVLIPVARLERQWPGGPVRGTFTARYGPDNTYLAGFEMTANDEAGVAKMLAQAVQRIDSIYSQALQEGRLAPDSTLQGTRGQIDAALADLIAQGRAADEAARAAAAANAKPTTGPTAAPTVAAPTTISIQFATPDAGSVDAALSAVRGSPGVQSASTTSLAMGGTSVMRVIYAGDPSALAAALRSRGWQVSGGGSSFSIKR